MRNELEAVTKDEILEDIETVATYSELIDHLKKAKRCAGFGDSTQVQALNHNETTISVLDVLESLNDMSANLNKDQLEEYLDENEGEMQELGRDNTYNYNGCIGNNLEYGIYKNAVNGEVLLSVAVHVGLDVRAGYSDNAIFLFDDEFQMWEALDVQQTIYHNNFTGSVDGGKALEYGVTVEGRVLSEEMTVTVRGMDDENENYYEEGYTCLDAFDHETMTDSVKEFVTNEFGLELA